MTFLPTQYYIVHENRTVLVTISTDEQLGSKLRKIIMFICMYVLLLIINSLSSAK